MLTNTDAYTQTHRHADTFRLGYADRHTLRNTLRQTDTQTHI
jgi:hypothetical protein